MLAEVGEEEVAVWRLLRLELEVLRLSLNVLDVEVSGIDCVDDGGESK